MFVCEGSFFFFLRRMLSHSWTFEVSHPKQQRPFDSTIISIPFTHTGFSTYMFTYFCMKNVDTWSHSGLGLPYKIHTVLSIIYSTGCQPPNLRWQEDKLSAAVNSKINNTTQQIATITLLSSKCGFTQLTEWYYILKANDAISIDISHKLNAFIIYSWSTYRRTWAECPCDNDNNNIPLDIHHLIPLKRQHWHFNCDYSDDGCIIIIITGRFFMSCNTFRKYLPCCTH